MRIHILSDLHLEFQPFILPEVDADVVVLAGDIHIGEKGIFWAINNIPKKPVIYVLGNHEYYSNAYPKLIDKLKQEAKATNINVMENQSIELDGITFLGCTLWTDFQLFSNARFAEYEASQQLNDFRKIRRSPSYSKLKPSDVAVIQKKSVFWLKESLSKIDTKKLVVVTHHAPSFKSIPLEYKQDILSASYASNLDDLVLDSKATLWIHGHIHSQLNYKIGSTQVICNPRGYPDEQNHLFDPRLVLDI